MVLSMMKRGSSQRFWGPTSYCRRAPLCPICFVEEYIKDGQFLQHVAFSSLKRSISEIERSLVQVQARQLSVNIWLQCYLGHAPSTTVSSVGKMNRSSQSLSNNYLQNLPSHHNPPTKPWTNFPRHRAKSKMTL